MIAVRQNRFHKIGVILLLNVIVVFCATFLYAAEIYTANSSSNLMLNFSTFRGFDKGGVGAPSDLTSTPCIPYPSCFEHTTEFGQNNVGIGSSDKSINQCYGKNDYFGDSCASGVDALDVLPVAPDISRILHTLSATSTVSLDNLSQQIASADPLAILPDSPSDGWIIETADDPVVFQQQVFNELISKSVNSSGWLSKSECESLSAWNDSAKKRCNEIDMSFTKNLDGMNNVDDINVDQGVGTEGLDFVQDFNISFSISSLTDENGNLIGDAEGSWTVDMNVEGGSGWGNGEAGVYQEAEQTTCTGTFKFNETDGFTPVSGDSPDWPCTQ